MKVKLARAQPVAIERAGHSGLEETAAGGLAVSVVLLHSRGG